MRAQLQKELEERGIEPLLEELQRVDPESAERLHPADTKRILRALEVWRETGKTITAHNEETKAIPPRYEALYIGLRFADRQDMWALIDRRVDAMVEEGLLEEVRTLLGSVVSEGGGKSRGRNFGQFHSLFNWCATFREYIFTLGRAQKHVHKALALD